MHEKSKYEYYYVFVLSFIYIIFYSYINSANPLEKKSILVFITSIIIGLFIINNSPTFNFFKNKIPIMKNAIYPFIIIYSINFCIIILDFRYGFISSYINNTFYKIILILFITSLIFVSYFWRIKISSFNFKLTLKTLTFTLVIYFIITVLNYASSRTVTFNFSRYIITLLNSIVNLIQPAFVEEYIYRGLLISGLLGFELSTSKVNIIQSIVFGIAHINQFPQLGILCFLPTIGHMLIGFILGKIYFKTGSLMPGILFHWLWNSL